MGRKIPGKKHRGVKNPEKQRAKRLSELENKINAPPKNVDDQDIPKSLERLIKLKNAAKAGLIQKKKKKRRKGEKLITIGGDQKTGLGHPKAKPDKVVPVFSQEPGESQYRFWNRVNRETQAFIKETEFETKFNVNVKRNAKTGYIEGVSKNPKDELDELKKLQLKHKNIKKKKKKVTDEEGNNKLTKAQKRKEKLLKKKQAKVLNDIDEFKTFKDKVEFGETVHAPPELKVHPKNVNKDAAKVKTKSLLLNSILQENNSAKTENVDLIKKIGKRKNLPMGERRQIEKQQSEAIAAYRELKARKFGVSTISA